MKTNLLALYYLLRAAAGQLRDRLDGGRDLPPVDVARLLRDLLVVLDNVHEGPAAAACATIREGVSELLALAESAAVQRGR